MPALRGTATLLQSRGGRRQGNTRPRQIQLQSSALQASVWHAPDRSNFHTLFPALGRSACYLYWLPILLFYVRLNHLSCSPSRQVAVFSFLQQRAHYNFRVSPRLDSGKPSVVLEV